MLAGSIHPPFRLNFLNPAHLYSSTTLLSGNNERASHLLLLAVSKHFSFTKTILSTTRFYIKIRASDLPHFEQTQKITNCHSRKREKNLQSLWTISFQIRKKWRKQASKKTTIPAIKLPGHTKLFKTKMRIKEWIILKNSKEKTNFKFNQKTYQLYFYAVSLRLRVEFRPQNSQDRCCKTTAQCEALSVDPGPKTESRSREL